MLGKLRLMLFLYVEDPEVNSRLIFEIICEVRDSYEKQELPKYFTFLFHFWRNYVAPQPLLFESLECQTLLNCQLMALLT